MSKKDISSSDQDVKSERHSFKIPYLIWLLSILMFFLCLVIWLLNTQNESLLYLLLFSVAIGSVSFLILVLRLIGKHDKKLKNHYGLLSLGTFIAFFALLMNFSSVAAQLGFPIPDTTTNTTKMNEPKPSPRILPSGIKATPSTVPRVVTSPQMTNNNQIECTGPDGKVFKTTQQECDSFNAAWGKDTQKNNSANANTNSSSREACVLGGKVYMLTRESCADFQKQNQDERIRQQAEVAEFNAEFEKDAEKRAEEKALRDLEYAVDMYENEKRLHDQCLRDAQSIKITLGSKCNNEAIYPTQAFRDDCWTKAEQGYARAVANCN